MMSQVVKNHERPYNKLILNQAFGKGHDLEEIKQNVKALKHSDVMISTVRGHLDKNTFAWAHSNGKIEFDHKYYTLKTDRERAGTLIHEASHAILGTKDNFVHDSKHGGIIPISARRSEALKGKGVDVTSGCKQFYNSEDERPEIFSTLSVIRPPCRFQ